MCSFTNIIYSVRCGKCLTGHCKLFLDQLSRPHSVNLSCDLKSKKLQPTPVGPWYTSVVGRSVHRRTLITSAHVIKCLAHTEFQSRGQLATGEGGGEVGRRRVRFEVTKCTWYWHSRVEAVAESVLWFGWRQVHKQALERDTWTLFGCWRGESPILTYTD